MLVGASKSVSGFDPRSIVGCSLWLDGADTATMNSTPTVTTWTDKSGQGNNVTGTATYSSGTITFNGTNQAFSNTTYVFPSNAYSMFAVYSNTTAPAATSYMNVVYGNGGYPMLGIYGYLNAVSARSVVANTGALSPNVAASSTVLVSATYTPSTFSPFINGSAETTLAGTTLAATGIYVGGPTNYFNGSISEILIYSATLTSTQRQSVEGYLTWKWGLRVRVPSPVTTPLSISGCALWLDGADPAGTGVKPSLGATVSSWVDKSGSGNTVTCPSSTYSSNSTTGQTGIFFNNSATSALTLSPYCSFFVSSYNTGPNFPTSYPGLLGSVAVIFFGNYYLGSNLYDAGGGWAPSRSVNRYGSYLSDSRNIAVNSVAAVPTAAISLRVGAGDSYPGGNQWIGHIYEVIVYNQTLTTSQRQSVENYLINKWGIVLSLPATHPFYSLPAFSRPFGPLDIPGCALWLDAADQSSMTFSSGNSVNLWRDKSGNNNNASQSTTANQPSTYTSANGLTGMNFSLSNYFRGSFSSPITGNKLSAFVILNMNSSTYGYGRALSLSTSNNNDYISGAGGTNISRNSSNVALWQEAFGNGAATVGPFSINTSTTYLVDSMFDGTTHTGYLNGTSVGSAAISSNFSIYLFGIGFQAYQLVSSSSDYWVGYINEVIVYSDALSTTQRQQIEGYLAAKWGLLSSVVSGHPFKSIPPSTSQPPQFQEVTPGNWKYDWQPYLQRLTAANSGATAVFSSNAVSGSEPNTNGSWSMNLAPNGLIYTFPTQNNSYIGIINPITSVYTYNAISTGLGTDGYKYIGGGALHPNGNIYVPPAGNPANSVNVGVFTPSGSSGTFTTIASTSNAVTDAFEGGAVLAPNGMIYFVPQGSAYIGRIDGNGTFTSNSVSGTVPTGNKYGGAALGPNGLIYCIPGGIGRNVGVIDPVANTYSSNYVTMVNTVVDYAFFGVVLAPNGKIYCIPRNSTTVGIIDPVANTFTNGPALSSATNAAGSGVGNDAYWGGCLGPDGNIYCAPVTANNILVINPTTNTVSYLSTGFTSPLYRGIIMAPNGKLYMKSAGNGPVGTRSVATISFTGLNQLPSSNWCLSAYANRSF